MIDKRIGLIRYASYMAFFLVLTAFFTGPIIAQASRPVLSISDYDTDPGILNTDDKYFDLDITLKNNGDECAIAATATVQVSSPFMIDERPTSKPKDICDEKTLTIPLSLEPDIVGGSYPLTVTVSYSGENNTGFYTFSNVLTVFIRGNSDINAHIVDSNPLKIYSGDTVALSVLIENDGSFKAENIKGTLSAKDPLKILSSQSYTSIGTLGPKQAAIEQFSLEIPKDAEADSYKMTLSLEYLEDGNRKKKDIPLVLNIEKKALFKAASSKTNQFYANSMGETLNLKIKNTGSDDARDLKVQIQPQFPFTSDGSIRYIESLAPGQSKDVEFVVNVDKSATIGDYAIDLIINFKDKEGNSLYETATAGLTVEKKSIPQVIFVDYWYLWVILLIVLIIILIRVSRHSSKKVS